jgi:hypothetical protein
MSPVKTYAQRDPSLAKDWGSGCGPGEQWGAGLWPVGPAGVSPAGGLLSFYSAGATPACPTAATAAPQL